MKSNTAYFSNTNGQSATVDWVDSPNVYAAARAERSRFVRAWFYSLIGKQVAAPNADGLAPLGITA